MNDSPALIALRKTLGDVVEDVSQGEKSKIAESVISKILDALEIGVCTLGNWETRCLSAAIISLRGGKFDQARTMARRALWPEENRTMASIAKFPARAGMSSVEELKREFVAACASRRKDKTD
jgi:hypothetical protein